MSRKNNPGNRRRDGGFTLVEMMVVIVIIGVLAAVLVTQIAGRSDRARQEATRVMIKQVKMKLEEFRLNHSRYPDRLDDLVVMPAYVEPKQWPRGGYFDEPIRDGWGREFVYRPQGSNNQPFDIVSYGADGREGGVEYDEDLWSHQGLRR